MSVTSKARTERPHSRCSLAKRALSSSSLTEPGHRAGKAPRHTERPREALWSPAPAEPAFETHLALHIFSAEVPRSCRRNEPSPGAPCKLLTYRTRKHDKTSRVLHHKFRFIWYSRREPAWPSVPAGCPVHRPLPSLTRKPLQWLVGACQERLWPKPPRYLSVYAGSPGAYS